MVDLLNYRERSKAEDYLVLSARLTNCLPDMQRLYNDGEAGELMPDGNDSLRTIPSWQTTTMPSPPAHCE